jgi:predicted nucleic acid-binding protein
MLASPGLVVLAPTPKHAAILAQTVREVPSLSGSVLHDVHTAVLMREHGIRRIVTRDRGFHRFPFLDVIDPLAPDWPDVVRERAPSRRKPIRRTKVRA